MYSVAGLGKTLSVTSPLSLPRYVLENTFSDRKIDIDNIKAFILSNIINF